MSDIAIVGGGPSRMPLARALRRRRRDFLLFEAQERLGRRVRSMPCPARDMRGDPDPAWFRLDRQPMLSCLVADFGQSGFRQYDTGTLLPPREADGPARPVRAAANRLLVPAGAGPIASEAP